jgi:hypothetical protein
MSKDDLHATPGPWRVDEDEDGAEADSFSLNGKLIFMVLDTGDPGETRENASLAAHSWAMREDVKKAIKFLHEGEDGEALKLLKATLQRSRPVQSENEPRRDGRAAANENGGAGR